MKAVFRFGLLASLISFSVMNPSLAQWTQTDGLYGGYFYSFLISGANLFAGTSAGVFLSTNSGSSWTSVNTGLISSEIRSLTVSGTNLFAGAKGGVWRRPLSEMVTSVERLPGDLPAHFNLAQNYPNPFNPITTIEFSVETYGHTSLQVFDVLGRKVAELINGEHSPGVYKVEWDASTAPSGVYFYRLQAGDFVQTRKLILMR